jgi:hypothetical protein
VSRRWRDWSPSVATIPEASERALTKLTKMGFVGFVSSNLVSFPIMEPSALDAVEVSVKVFPHCPRCASYALYRPNNVGSYECQTCGLLDISEDSEPRASAK